VKPNKNIKLKTKTVNKTATVPKTLKNMSSSANDLRENTNYPYSRKLGKIFYIVGIVACLSWGLVSCVVGLIQGSAMSIIGPISAFLLFVLLRLSIESYNMLIDMADASIAQVQLQKEFSEKTDKTNTLLHHIYQNSTKAPPPPSS